MTLTTTYAFASTVQGWASSTGTLTYDATTGKTANGCLKFVTTNATATASLATTGATLGVPSSARITAATMSLYVKGDSAGADTISVGDSGLVAITGTFAQVTGTLTVSSSPAAALTLSFSWAWDTATAIYVDDIVLTLTYSYSREEKTRDEWVTLCESITTANGYRSNVAEVYTVPMDLDQVPLFPSVSVIFGTESFAPNDDARTLYFSNIEVTLLAYISSDNSGAGTDLMLQGEAFLHDLKRLVAANLTSSVNSTTNKWTVLGGLQKVERFLVPGWTKGWVSTSFTVRVHVQGSDL